MTGRDPSERMAQLARNAAADIAAAYRIDRDAAAARILEIWQRDAALKEALAREPSDDRVMRMRAFRQAVASARRTIYFDLRRYRQDESDLPHAARQLGSVPPGAEPQRVAEVVRSAASTHVSIAERLDHIEDFFAALLEAIGEPEHLVDVGGGVLPLIFPFDRVPTLRRYVLLERDPAIVGAVAAYSRWRGDGIIAAQVWDIKDGWDAVTVPEPGFDVALMLKLVPVIRRQFPQLLATLGSVPAQRVIVTGSKQGLVKRRSIVRRELGVIQDFAEHFEFEEIGRFETADEVGLILRKSAP
ncbi:MAG: hypothetical protein E6G97_21570 [Alphaproteobacteria bacterium]|nr:MAG: hypothetical protein E6G97_21570 [Alphaproteobacteria bacterium]